MNPLKKTLLLASASLFVFGSAQAHEATDENQVTTEARQAERDARRAEWESMSDEERAAARAKRNEARNQDSRNRDEQRVSKRKSGQEGDAARNSQRQRPSGKGRPKRDRAE